MNQQTTKPNPLLDPFVPAFSAWSIVAAASVGIFDSLADGKKTPIELAKDLDLEVDGVNRLMPVLVHLGYVEAQEERFCLTKVSRQTLTQGSQPCFVNWVRFCRTQLLAMSHLQSALCTGQSVDLYDLMRTEKELRVHQLAMAETAGLAAEWVAENTPVPNGAKLMLDIGGSHGLYSAAICRQNPPLRAQALELPVVVEVARSVACELGTDDVVTHVEGDIRNTNLNNEYSLVFAANLLHHLKADQLPGVAQKPES